MSVTCPVGHTSESTDWCDVCGAPISAASSSATPVPAPAAAVPAPSACPHCGSPAASDALFCENCGYDFTTGATPVAATAPAAGPSAAAAPAAVSSLDLGPTPPAAPVPAEGDDGSAPDPLEAPPAVALPAGASSEAGSAPSSASVPPPAPDEDAWVAELWVDPDWYDLQRPEDPMPSVGLPVLVPLRERSLLVGRPSVSRNIRPQVDAGADSGVSRRHCQLNTDGHRWWVEDLQSSNGTFVARVGEPLPETPIPPGQRHELQDGDRLYLGSWTRLVIRRALPGEV